MKAYGSSLRSILYSNTKLLLVLYLIISAAILLTGCQQAVKVIIIPVAAGGSIGGLLVFLAIVGAIDSCDRKQLQSRKYIHTEMGGPIYQDRGFINNGNVRAAEETVTTKIGNCIYFEFNVIIPYDGQYDIKVFAKKPTDSKFVKVPVKHAQKLGTSITVQLYEDFPVGTKFKSKFYF